MLHRSSSDVTLEKAVQNYYQNEKWRDDLFQGGKIDHSITDLCKNTKKLCDSQKAVHRELHPQADNSHCLLEMYNGGSGSNPHFVQICEILYKCTRIIWSFNDIISKINWKKVMLLSSEPGKPIQPSHNSMHSIQAENSKYHLQVFAFNMLVFNLNSTLTLILQCLCFELIKHVLEIIIISL